jgi:hypothetical protein
VAGPSTSLRSCQRQLNKLADGFRPTGNRPLTPAETRASAQMVLAASAEVEDASRKLRAAAENFFSAVAA